MLIILPFIFQLFERSIWFALVIILPILSLFKNPDENNAENNYKDFVHKKQETKEPNKGIFDEMESGWKRSILLNFPQNPGLRGLFAVVILTSLK